MIPRSVVVGRRFAAWGLVLSAVAVAALLVMLGTWWVTGTFPFLEPSTLDMPVEGPP